LIVAGSLLALALFGIAAVFVLYPSAVWLTARGGPRRTGATADAMQAAEAEPPRITLVTAVRNGGKLIEAKLANVAELDYPRDRLQVVIASDGSTDGTAERLARCQDPLVVPVVCAHHVGKAEALNRAVAHATGDVLVFTDADARLAPDALRLLVRHLADPEVGGVCGRRRLGEPGSFAQGAQSSYVSLDSRVKELESRAGSITSNDGKLHCLRRELFRPVPPGVTDDLFACLSVVAQGRRFVFEPHAIAWVRTPSRSTAHELQRRRRIVARSLRGIYLMRAVLNPMHFGRYSVGLTVNKVLRRALPLCLLATLFTSAYLAPAHGAGLALLAAQLAFYAAALAHVGLVRVRAPRPLRRLTSLPFYVCVGFTGTLLGVVDFLLGKRVTRWDPVKVD
jgi:cellulose synthase/poly-beta-1,6-N-acetylglucosamine synthase-like glycosyltransferase